MANVYPENCPHAPIYSSVVNKNTMVLTVWKKSLLFNCDGYTVFDSNGNLVYRVDNYVPGGNGEIVLMDATGHSLLTIRRKRLSLFENWLVYDGETTVNPRISVTKHINIQKKKSLANVTLEGGNKRQTLYDIEGSYAQRCCVVYDGMRRCVADIKHKEAKGGVSLGGDVFQLIVQPLIDSTVAMALVIILDHMFGSSRRIFM